MATLDKDSPIVIKKNGVGYEFDYIYFLGEGIDTDFMERVEIVHDGEVVDA